MKRLIIAAALCLLTVAAAQAQTKKQLYKWGQECLNRGNYECAENAYRKLLVKEADDVLLSRCYVNLGFACHKQGRQSEAMKHYEMAAEKDPGNWRAWGSMATMLYNDERYTEALPYYEKAVENGGDNNLRRHRAFVYDELKMWLEAIEDYEYLLRENARDYRTMRNLAGIMINIGDNEKALEYADRAIAVNDGYAAAYVARGIALLNMKRKPEAKEAFEKASSLGSDNKRLPGLIEKCED